MRHGSTSAAVQVCPGNERAASEYTRKKDRPFHASVNLGPADTRRQIVIIFSFFHLDSLFVQWSYKGF